MTEHAENSHDRCHVTAPVSLLVVIVVKMNFSPFKMTVYFTAYCDRAFLKLLI